MRRCVMGWVAVFLFAALAAGDDKAAKTLKDLQGSWQAIVVVHSGQDAPDEGIKEFKVVIKGDTITFVQGKTEFKHKLKVDPSQSPMHFDIVALEGPQKGETSLGIYTLDKDILRVCHPNDPDQKDKRPKELKTKDGDGLSLLVLEKIK